MQTFICKYIRYWSFVLLLRGEGGGAGRWGVRKSYNVKEPNLSRIQLNISIRLPSGLACVLFGLCGQHLHGGLELPVNTDLLYKHQLSGKLQRGLEAFTGLFV